MRSLIYKTFFSILFLVFASGCAKKSLHLKSAEGKLLDATGLDGCGYIILLDKPDANGAGNLEVLNSISGFQVHDGDRVSCTYIEMSTASVCMVGTTVKIISIKRN